MKTTLFLLAAVLVWCGDVPAADTLTSRSLRINATALQLVATNRFTPKVAVAATDQKLNVKVPMNTELLVRKGDTFTKAVSTRREGTNQVYELKPTDVYVARGTPVASIPLSTNRARLPDEVRTVVNGREVTGFIEVALQSERMVLNPVTSQFEGLLGLCFRSPSAAAEARKLLPITLRLLSTPGIQLATNTVIITDAGNSGCRDIPIQCSGERQDAKITVKSDAVGDQLFTVEFDKPPVSQRYKDVLIILGGIALGALGGLVRTWHPPRTRHPWKRVATGAFCGLVLVLLGQVGVQRLFHIDGQITTSVILGLCGVLGYLGVRMFELFAPKESGEDDKDADSVKPKA